MDIWAWFHEDVRQMYEEGEHIRLAQLLTRLPGAATDDRHDEVDAIVPEALSLIEELDHPWLEIFVRHWNLQSRVLKRCDVDGMLPEAVALVEFSHRDENAGCPQSVCTTQDLTATYGYLDGPGYAQERIDACDQTLERIDPSWPCFSCITAQKNMALLDAGRLEESLEHIEATVEAYEAHNPDEEVPPYSLLGEYVDTLLTLERYEEALELAQGPASTYDGEHSKKSKQLDQALALVGLERFEDALERLPDFEAISPTESFYEHWRRTIVALVDADVVSNDWTLRRQLTELFHNLVDKGARRYAFEMGATYADLAIRAGHPELASVTVESLEALIPELHRPLGAPERLASLREALTSVDQPELAADLADFDHIDAYLEAIPHDPESMIQHARAALESHPDNETLVMNLSNAWRAVGWASEARDVLGDFLDAHPKSPDVILQLGNVIREEDGTQQLERFVADMRERTDDARTLGYCDWLLAVDAYNRGEFESAAHHVDIVLEAHEDWVGALTMGAELARLRGDLEVASERIERAIELAPDPGQYDFERLIIGTLREDWEQVRDSGRRLGFELDGDGPIDNPGPTCLVRFVEEEGEAVYTAEKRSPVVAEIQELAIPERTQHYGARVALEPQPIGQHHVGEEIAYVYDCFQVLSSSEYRSFAVEGIWPGEEDMEQLENRLQDIDCALRDLSDPNEYGRYLEDAWVPAMYSIIGIPEDGELDEVITVLREWRSEAEFADMPASLASTFERSVPVFWPQLAAAAGDDDEAREHCERAESDWGLTIEGPV